MIPQLESPMLWAALIAYVIAGVIGLIALVWRKHPERTVLALMTTGVLLHSAAIGLRWERIGHLPVGTAFEALSANVWGLALAVTVAYWRIPAYRPAMSISMAVIFLVMGWMMLIPDYDSVLPATYNTIWLFIHIGFYKIFLGAALVAVGVAGVVLLRSRGIGVQQFARMPDDRSLDELGLRCMIMALIFDSLGLIAGAIWAQDAWGRYWDWDPLEVWSLLTWIAIAASIHLRITLRVSTVQNALVINGVFILAFLAFFGIPFVSRAVHQGAV